MLQNSSLLSALYTRTDTFLSASSIHIAAIFFFPGLFFIIFFLFLLIYGGLGFGVLGLGSYFGFLGLGLSVDGVWGLWCGAFWVFWVWALYINIKE